MLMWSRKSQPAGQTVTGSRLIVQICWKTCVEVQPLIIRPQTGHKSLAEQLLHAEKLQLCSGFVGGALTTTSPN